MIGLVISLESLKEHELNLVNKTKHYNLIEIKIIIHIQFHERYLGRCRVNL